MFREKERDRVYFGGTGGVSGPLLGTTSPLHKKVLVERVVYVE